MILVHTAVLCPCFLQRRNVPFDYVSYSYTVKYRQHFYTYTVAHLTPVTVNRVNVGYPFHFSVAYMSLQLSMREVLTQMFGNYISLHVYTMLIG